MLHLSPGNRGTFPSPHFLIFFCVLSLDLRHKFPTRAKTAEKNIFVFRPFPHCLSAHLSTSVTCETYRKYLILATDFLCKRKYFFLCNPLFSPPPEHIFCIATLMFSALGLTFAAELTLCVDVYKLRRLFYPK